MTILSQKQHKILELFLNNPQLNSSSARAELVKNNEKISLVTVKRNLSQMAKQGVLEIIGSGRSTFYRITTSGRIFANIDAKKYIAVEPDLRQGLHKYNFEVFRSFPKNIFSSEEINILDRATKEYRKRVKNLPAAILKKELERLIIELSWKSSRIEGNTYTLLDTEKLLLENKKAPGHSKKEAQMILNHKRAFTFIHENKKLFGVITKRNLEQIHSLLVKNLDVGTGLRGKPVGVTGSIFQPLDNVYQITESIQQLSKLIARLKSPYAKALVALLGTSYIQPFEDGNKRTARLMANAVLLAYGLAPLSYRSVIESEYREAMLVFYETNSILPFKKIFVAQYDFAARTYGVK